MTLYDIYLSSHLTLSKKANKLMFPTCQTIATAGSKQQVKMVKIKVVKMMY